MSFLHFLVRYAISVRLHYCALATFRLSVGLLISVMMICEHYMSNCPLSNFAVSSIYIDKFLVYRKCSILATFYREQYMIKKYKGFHSQLVKIPEHGECPLLVGRIDLVFFSQPDSFHSSVTATTHYPTKLLGLINKFEK